MSGIRIQVETQYIAEHSDERSQRYAFAYTIAITNLCETEKQLHSRHWIITDGNQKVQEVRGEGVVGQQPWIQPGETHTYTSGAVLQTPVGTMEGSYEMRDRDGNRFNALIPRFLLARPGALH